MKKLIYIVMLMFMSSVFMVSSVVAEDQVQQQQVYGWELMTPEERAQHRETMRNLKTEEEREAYRLEHHQRMMERAQQRGVKLAPFQPGRGMGEGGRSR